MRAFAPQLSNIMQRILSESEDAYISPDIARLNEITESTLEQMKGLVPGRA
jgi:hypothetical protein